MSSPAATVEKPTEVRGWIHYGLIILVAEKIIQHVLVTLAFIYDFVGIRATVAIDYNYLLYSGAAVALLFGLTFWSLLKKQRWGLNLVIGLALLDIVGEFVTQGSIFITLNVSFIVAIALLVWVWLYKRNLRHKTTPA
jgi:hypothetical protein